jgi:hypothetical protein
VADKASARLAGWGAANRRNKNIGRSIDSSDAQLDRKASWIGARTALMLTVPPDLCRSRCQALDPWRTRILCTPAAIWIVEGAFPTNIPSTSISAPGWLAVMFRVVAAPCELSATSVGWTFAGLSHSIRRHRLAESTAAT